MTKEEANMLLDYVEQFLTHDIKFTLGAILMLKTIALFWDDDDLYEYITNREIEILAKIKPTILEN